MRIILTLLLFLPLNLIAEIYVVDVQHILNQSDAGKKAKSSLEDKFQSTKDGIEKRKNELVKMQEDVKKQSSLLSEEALQKKIISIRAQEKEVYRSMQSYQDKFMKENSAKISKIMDNINDILSDLAKEKGYAVVLEKNDRIVLYAEDRFDITDEVISRLNDRKISF